MGILTMPENRASGFVFDHNSQANLKNLQERKRMTGMEMLISIHIFGQEENVLPMQSPR